MENILKLTFEPNENLINDLSLLDTQEVCIIEQKKLSGLESVLLYTAIINLTDTALKLILTILERYKSEKIEIVINGDLSDYKNLKKIGKKKKR